MRLKKQSWKKSLFFRPETVFDQAWPVFAHVEKPQIPQKDLKFKIGGFLDRELCRTPCKFRVFLFF